MSPEAESQEVWYRYKLLTNRDRSLLLEWGDIGRYIAQQQAIKKNEKPPESKCRSPR